MNLLNKIKREWKYFKDNWRFLKILNSPFKPLKLYWYFGNIEKGVPYFLPRKVVNSKTKPGYYEFKPLKYFGFNWCTLGYKIKWSDTDYRHEWNPAFSFVIFGKQLHIEIQPKLYSNGHYRYSYWEAWLVYEYHTDKKLSKADRLKQCMKIMHCIWKHYENGKEVRENHYNYILKDKYLKYIE